MLMPSLHVRDPRKSYRANKIRKPKRRVAHVFQPADILEVLQKSPAIREQIYHRMSLSQGVNVASDLRYQVDAAERAMRRKP